MFITLTINSVPHSANWELLDEPLHVHVSSHTLGQGARYGCTTELQCTFSSRMDHDGLRAVGVRAAFPGSMGPHYLGPTGNEYITALLVDTSAIETSEVDVVLELQRFNERCCVAPDPAELQLANHVLTVIANDECLGSIPTSVLQNKVLNLPFYEPAMRSRGASSPFTKFLKRFDRFFGYWKVFRYLPDQTALFQTHSFDLDGLRVTTNALFRSNSYLDNDLARERIHHRARMEIQEQMEELRRNGASSSLIVAQLGESRSFKTLQEVQFSRLMRNFKLFEDMGVVHHPLHAVMMVRGVGTEERFARF
jgi:hypothetical protein